MLPTEDLSLAFQLSAFLLYSTHAVYRVPNSQRQDIIKQMYENNISCTVKNNKDKLKWNQILWLVNESGPI